ncbi:uncharacterized protein LOC142320541 [Lycorma delicatula]|uniref:uncharacterized protein LOC142320541 n=1 Tax=Lycorma delicatula TaxID=130591 RepID=UPI003F510BFC
MENMKLVGCEPVVYIKEEHTHISALNPIDLNIQDEEDEIGDKSEHKVYCSLTVVNPEEITYDSVGSDDYNSDWVFGLQSSEGNVVSHVNHVNQQITVNVKNTESSQQSVECDLSNDSTYSRLNDNSSSDNSMYTYYSLPNDSSLVNFSPHETTLKRVDFKDWNKVVPEPKKVVTKAEKSPPVKKTFACQICNKVFASKSNLERHGVVHSDVKPFQCVECKRMFSRRVHLERHKFLHMDQKPFNCEVCKKGFTQKTHLEKHQYVHTGVKPFECLICKKSFARKESLNRHKGIHANEKKDAATVVDNKSTAEKKNALENKNNPPENKESTDRSNMNTKTADDVKKEYDNITNNKVNMKIKTEKMDDAEVNSADEMPESNAEVIIKNEQMDTNDNED